MKVCLVLALGLTLLSSGACAQVGEELPLQAGRLQAAGGYAHPPYSRSPARLADGSLLLVGEGVFDAGPWRPTSGMAKLQRRHDQPNTGGPHPEPKRWDPRRRGWVKLPALPICPSGRYALHSVLPLTDGRAWLAGGLCDAPRMADDTSPRGAFSATQLWDPQQQAWQSGPNTGQQRLLHTATLLDDGSAVLAGGMADPSLVQLPGPPVLRSVQRFDGKSLQSLPEMLQARARHSATALPGGRLLVAGGFGASGQALASAELWDPGEARWQALPPLPAPRYGHTALLLADGRLALVGGLNAKHQASDSLLFFEPQTQRWIPGPPLPLPLHSPGAAQLSSGALLVAGGAQDDLTDSVPWAWVLDEGANAWRLGGQASPLRRGEMVEPVTIWPEASGSALLATPAGFLRYRPDRDAQAALRAAPAWARRPEAVALRPDLALWAGTVHDPDAGAQVQTWFWGAAAGWRRVAAPPLAEHAELRLLALRAGEALLLARSTGT
ncbi:MAG: Kelch repeat-containing protein [Burkholderiales bacterium]